jgi:hypothetical protein
MRKQILSASHSASLLSFNPLPWSAALLIALLITLGLGAMQVILANDQDAPMELTLEEAKELAYANNPELQFSILALEEAELTLQILLESMNELEDRLDELSGYKADLEARQAEIQEEIDYLVSIGDPDEQLPRLYQDLLEVQIALQVADTAIEVMDLAFRELENQYNQAELALQEGRELAALQEEMLEFQVEALFAGCLMILEQQPLQQASLEQLGAFEAAEQNKKNEGYSTALEVEAAASKKRDLEAAGDALQYRYVELVDQLCLTCGLSPGIPLTLVPFTPIQPQQVDLNEAMDRALAAGWLIQLRRQRYNELEAERERIGEAYGYDSTRYQMADLVVRRAQLELQQAEGETRAAVRRTYFAVLEKEGGIRRAEANLTLGRLQKEALEAQFAAGYSTPAEAAQAPLALWKKEAELISARYLYHIAYLEFDLARRGYFINEEPTY